jgi:hypothetical protein
LRAGATLAVASAPAVTDVLTKDSRPIAPLATLTDGVWVWPADLAYYIETYHVRLPDEFAEHAASNSWIPPKLTHADLVELSARESAED